MNKIWIYVCIFILALLMMLVYTNKKYETINCSVCENIQRQLMKAKSSRDASCCECKIHHGMN